MTTSLVDLMRAKMRVLLSCTQASLRSGNGSVIRPSTTPSSLLLMIVCASFIEWMLASFQRSDDTSIVAQSLSACGAGAGAANMTPPP